MDNIRAISSESYPVSRDMEEAIDAGVPNSKYQIVVNLCFIQICWILWACKSTAKFCNEVSFERNFWTNTIL